MKKKICKLSAAVLLFFSGIMEIGWRFLTWWSAAKRGRKGRRNGLNYLIYGIIIQKRIRKGYDESRAWCEAQRCRTAISKAWMD